ncbi:MAG: GatB/YqeY domain-containing protein [Verrucomicrobiae bacterium]|nr:GatB/YqeY domain-containing protein [Verrucomicrobiae bacterium]
MNLTEQIDSAIKEAMKAKDALRLETLRMVKSALKYTIIETKGPDGKAEDADVIATIRKQIKMRQDTLASFAQGGRTDAGDNERREISILEAFLPAQMSAEELETIVKSTLTEIGATSKKQMGDAMKAVMAKVAGRAESRAISTLVGKFLN